MVHVYVEGIPPSVNLPDLSLVVAQKVVDYKSFPVANKWVEEDEPTSIGHLPGGLYDIRVNGSGGVALASKSLHLGEGEEVDIHLDLGGEAFSVRVLDNRRRPVAMADLVILHGEEKTLGHYTTDESGVASVTPPALGSAVAFISHPSIGHAWGVAIEFSGDGRMEPIDVEMSCEASAALRVVDRTGPLTNQMCRLFGTGFVEEVALPKATDTEGYVTFDRLSPGPYQLRIDSPGHWPYYQDREASIGGEVQEILVPRLANLTVEVRNAQGILVRDQPVRVWSLDYDKDTRNWQDVGAMSVDPADWRTDVTGRVTIPVFPEGTYRCSTEAPDGTQIELTFEVRPGQANIAVLGLP